MQHMHIRPHPIRPHPQEITHLVAQIQQYKHESHHKGQLVVHYPLERHLLHQELDGQTSSILCIPRLLIATATELISSCLKQGKFTSLQKSVVNTGAMVTLVPWLHSKPYKMKHWHHNLLPLRLNINHASVIW